jgi:hypothetical protein
LAIVPHAQELILVSHGKGPAARGFVVQRLDRDLQLAGWTSHDFGAPWPASPSSAVARDGKLVIAGTAFFTPSDRGVVARLWL